MASRVGDPAKLAEAQEEFEKGNKAIATSVFKWKADYLTAEPHFKAAARLFKSGGMQDSALEAYKKAAHCSAKLGNVKQASLTLEQAAKESSLVAGGKLVASELFAEAADFLLLAGDVVRASDLRLQAGKQLEGLDKDRAARLYDAAAEVFDGQEDKDVYAVTPLQKIFREQVIVGKHASAMRTLDRLMAIYARLKQPHNTTKALLSRVVLLLAAADPVSAQREFERHLGTADFAASPEGAAAEDMINAYTEMDVETMKKVVERSAINYLEQPVAKLAKAFPAVMLSGSQVGIAHAGEAASHGVDTAPAAPAGPGGLRAFGGGGGAATPGGSGGRGASSVAGDRDDARARSELFSRPAQREPVSAAPAVAAAFSDAPEPAHTAARGPPAASAAAEGEGADYDYARAFADMGGVDEEDAGDADAAPKAHGGAGEPAPAAAGSAPEDEDLGLM